MEAGLDNWVDILVIALYFFFVMAVGVWVSDNCTVTESFCLYILIARYSLFTLISSQSSIIHLIF